MMTEEQYEAKRIHIDEQYKTMVGRAVAWRDQQMALLFHESGWTQERIAEKEGRTNQWVSYRLRFGRFVEFLPTVVGKPPRNLTEGKFRQFWEKAGGDRVAANSAGERAKFQAIIDSEEWEFTIADNPPINPTLQIKQKCVDGKWRTQEEIAELMDGLREGSHAVQHAISGIKRECRHGLMVKTKEFAGGVQKYKFSEIDNKDIRNIRAPVIIDELRPIAISIRQALTMEKATPYDRVELAMPVVERLEKFIKRYS